jgi:hypothetical protein
MVFEKPKTSTLNGEAGKPIILRLGKISQSQSAGGVHLLEASASFTNLNAGYVAE